MPRSGCGTSCSVTMFKGSQGAGSLEESRVLAEKGKISDYDLLFHDVLGFVQESRPDLIGSDVTIDEEFLLRCSLHCAHNQGIPGNVIKNSTTSGRKNTMQGPVHQP